MIATSIRPTRDPLFLDTSFLIALNAADDQYHKRAADHWRLIGRTNPLLTTTYIVDEVVTSSTAVEDMNERLRSEVC